MRDRYPIRWLMTDERMGDDLWEALRRLPPGSGVVFRHGRTPADERVKLFCRIRRIARARGLILVARGAMPGADGIHGTGGVRSRSWPVHDRRQAIAGVRRGARILFVSPIYATRSHRGAAVAGPLRAARWTRGLDATVIALGGMDERRWRRIRHLGFDGWAGIDAWLPPQKRKAVPT